MEDWRIRYPQPWQRLSSGSFGEVSLAFDSVNQSGVAIKRQEAGERSRREVNVLKRLKDCEQIVGFLNCFEEGSVSYIVMVYYPLGTLARHLSRCYRLGLTQAASAFSQLATAVYSIQRLGLQHGDLHAGNVLVADIRPDGYILVKLADFGEATTERSAQPATSRDDLGYYSPSSSSDVYSLGQILHQMLTGKMPREPNYDNRGVPLFSTEHSNHLGPAAGVLQSLMHQNEDERIVLTENTHAHLLYDHPFMASAKAYPFACTIGQEMDREFKKRIKNTTTRWIDPYTGKELRRVDGGALISHADFYGVVANFERHLNNTKETLTALVANRT